MEISVKQYEEAPLLVLMAWQSEEIMTVSREESLDITVNFSSLWRES